jgi:diguanylate cyclase (GGDEF)-like protein/putative nucleotidyltransferase with HDIG domain
MNSYSIFQFSNLIIYIILIVVITRYARTKPKGIFLIYLVAASFWSLSSFLAHASFTGESAYFWIRLIPFGAMWVLVAYSHFITTFVQRGTRLVFRIGYGYLIIITIMIALGYIPRGIIPIGDYNISPDYGPWLIVFTVFGLYIMGTAAYVLIRSYQASRDPMYRNRIAYLLIGIGLMTVFGFVSEFLPPPRYPVDHIGHLGNAIVISYAILRYRLLDVKIAIRKGLVYSGITAFITTVYLIVLFGLQQFLHTWATTASLVAIIAMTAVMALVFNPIRFFIQNGVDKLFYGKRYDYRQMVLSFAHRMSNVMELDELAEAFLQPITQAVNAKQASLLFTNNDDFSSRFAFRSVKQEPVIPIHLRLNGPIAKRLQREDGPLFTETLDIEPEFKGLWQEERDSLEAAEVEVLFPIKSKHSLIAILALSRKHPRGSYESDDIDLMMTLANEAAVVIENARIYERAKQRANTDELTGLFNHRYFHQRLDEEIARSSRFGHVFSLILFDLDLFKTYNDIHGHLAGDDILKQVAQHIKLAIRRIDIGVRYGGDEFAVILPQTSVDDAHVLAERLRHRIESRTDSKGIPVTCSMGVASWPTDGVMREDIVQAADGALYYAKQTGRNRICLASEVALSEVLKMEVPAEGKGAILSTIYALAATVDAKDHHTYGHSKKVTKYATDIAEALGYSEEKLASIRAAALLHDIGKIGVSDRLLEKTGTLSPEDWEPIRAHPNLGVAILKHVEGLRDSLPGVQYHHERYDGAGYPVGLKGENIPLDARILAIADSYDAMTSLRPYRPGKFTHEQAIAELERCAGTQFDPTIIRVFASLDRETQPKVAKTNQRRYPLVAN